jgi:hypothetical protein
MSPLPGSHPRTFQPPANHYTGPLYGDVKKKRNLYIDLKVKGFLENKSVYEGRKCIRMEDGTRRQSVTFTQKCSGCGSFKAEVFEVSDEEQRCPRR